MVPRSSLLALACLAPLVILSACRSQLQGGLERRCTETGVAPPTADAISGLPNFGRVDDGLFRCGQPSNAGFREAARQGIRTVVNARSSHSDAALLTGTELSCVRIPMHAWRVTDDEVARFLRVATDPASRPVLVHCAHGQDRTGVLVAAYRRVIEGWSAADALRELDAYGASPLWSNLRAYIEHLDVAHMKALIETTPLPPAEAPTRKG